MRSVPWSRLSWCWIGLFCWAACSTGLSARSSENFARPESPGTLAKSPPKRLALLVGIDDYSAASPTPDISKPPTRNLRNLEGAVRDVRALERLLVEAQGFRPEDVRVLTDRQATHSAILAAIESDLVERIRPGDLALFYYSGHGSQVANSLSDEPDKLDETIVPADSRFGAHDITDKELRKRFNQLLDHGALLTVILDSCHSGSGAREGLLTASVPRGVDPDLRDIRDGSPAGPRPEDRGAVVLTATQDSGSAWESVDEQKRARGAFSLALERALRDRLPDEPASFTFARARARLQAEQRYQEPSISGKKEAVNRPLFGLPGPEATPREPGLAVERTNPDGMIELQGGIALGLTVGSRLRLEGSDVKLEVVKLKGFSRCEARRLPGSEAARRVPDPKPGTLAKVVQWAAAPGPPLKVWLSDGEGLPESAALTHRLAKLAPQWGVHWLIDPTETPPSHVLRRNRIGWELVGSKTGLQELGPNPRAETVLDRVGRDGRLFVQLPAPPDLLRWIRVGPGTPNDGVESVDRPEGADYLLIGRLRETSVEYAWIRPDGATDERLRSPNPARTAWQPFVGNHQPGDRDAAENLEDRLLRLLKIRAWQQLAGPSGGEFDYELELRRVGSSSPVADGSRLIDRQHYQFVLRPRPDASDLPTVSRYIYIFTIDSVGDSTLLFPLNGSENRFPIRDEEVPAAIVLPQTMTIYPPFGQDTYILLTSEESIPNPRILEFSGVRSRGPKGATGLEELLAQIGGTSRQEASTRTTVAWSIERRYFVSAPTPASPHLP